MYVRRLCYSYYSTTCFECTHNMVLTCNSYWYIIIEDKGEITATPVSSTAIKIINNGSNMYHCWVNKTGSSRYNTEIKTQNSKKVRDLLPDTIYVIKCVEVGADGQYQCTEYNNIVLTGEER